MRGLFRDYLDLAPDSRRIMRQVAIAFRTKQIERWRIEPLTSEESYVLDVLAGEIFHLSPGPAWSALKAASVDTGSERFGRLHVLHQHEHRLRDTSQEAYYSVKPWNPEIGRLGVERIARRFVESTS